MMMPFARHVSLLSEAAVQVRGAGDTEGYIAAVNRVLESPQKCIPPRAAHILERRAVHVSRLLRLCHIIISPTPSSTRESVHEQLRLLPLLLLVPLQDFRRNTGKLPLSNHAHVP